MTEDIALIFNPAAGGGRALERWQRIDAFLKKKKLNFELFLTESEAHLQKVSVEVARKFPIIIGAGGDTTLNVIATEIIRQGYENKLATIGLGSMNDVCRELGVRTIEHVYRAISEKRNTRMDVGQLTLKTHPEPIFFLGAASFGLGVIINRNIDAIYERRELYSRYRPLVRTPAFFYSVFKAFQRGDVPIHFKLKMEGGTRSFYSPFVIMNNTVIIAKAFHPTPIGSSVDGRIDCCFFLSDTPLQFSVNTIRLMMARDNPLKPEDLEIISCPWFKLTVSEPLDVTVDGKIHHAGKEIEVNVLPRKLSVFSLKNLSGKKL